MQAVNTELVDLYWQVGEFISGKIETATWGEGVVDELARFIARRHPDIKGFTRRSLLLLETLAARGRDGDNTKHCTGCKYL